MSARLPSPTGASTPGCGSALDFDEVFIQVDFPQDSIAANHAMDRKGVEEFVGENAADHFFREVVDPLHVKRLQNFPLAFAHGGAAFQNSVGECLRLKDVSSQQAAAGAEFHDREGIGWNVELFSHRSEPAGQELAENRIQVGGGVVVAFPAERIFRAE